MKRLVKKYSPWRKGTVLATLDEEVPKGAKAVHVDAQRFEALERLELLEDLSPPDKETEP